MSNDWADEAGWATALKCHWDQQHDAKTIAAALRAVELRAWNEAIEAAAKLVSIVPAAMIGSSETYPKAYKDACYHAAISIRSLRKEQT